MRPLRWHRALMANADALGGSRCFLTRWLGLLKQMSFRKIHTAGLSELIAWAQGCPAVEGQIPSGSDQTGRQNWAA